MQDHVNSILLKRWKALNHTEKEVWEKWEVWDAKRYACQMKIYQEKKRRTKRAKTISLKSTPSQNNKVIQSNNPCNNQIIHETKDKQKKTKTNSSNNNNNQNKSTAPNNNLVIYDHHDRQWNEMFDKLLEYKRLHGDTNVPQRYQEIPKLGPWVNQQRQKRKRGKVPDHRINKLDSIGFIWDPVKSGARYDPIWNAHYDELVTYYKSHGHCRVTKSDDKVLNGWVIEQRVQFHRGTLKNERKEKLDSLDFQWEVFDDLFASHLEKLKQYKEKHGDCLVPAEDEELGSWVVRLRSLAEKGKLAEDRRMKLDELGFVWRVGLTKEGAKIKWQEQYAKLEEYSKKHGDCLIPNAYDKDPELGIWVSNQRSNWKEGVLLDDRKALLDEIGFDWDPKEKVHKAVIDAKWESRYSELKAFRQQHGHCEVPPGTALSSWIKSQRTARYNKSSTGRRLLSEEDIRRLDEIDFIWKPKDDTEQWESMFKSLSKYKSIHGNCLVRKRDEEDENLAKLGKWVQTQRRLKKKGRMQQDREKKLDDLGFVWSVRDCAEQDQTKNDEKWLINYKELCSFYLKNGHTLVPTQTTLGVWVAHQRYLFKQNELKEDRSEMLEEIEFVWSVDHYDAEKSMKAKHWEDMYNKLASFRSKMGHCDVPHGHSDEELAKWVRTQRGTLTSGWMHQSRKARLDKIGFSWKRNAAREKLNP